MALKEIKTTIQISATPQRVWEVLTDFNQYKNWNPFITSVEGDFKVGEIVSINAGGMKFKPKVLEYKENKEVRWLGKFLFKGLFDGEHSFVIIDNEDGSSTFEHNEVFRGILVGLFSNKLDTETKKGFIDMNNELKKIAES